MGFEELRKKNREAAEARLAQYGAPGPVVTRDEKMMAAAAGTDLVDILQWIAWYKVEATMNGCTARALELLEGRTDKAYYWVRIYLRDLQEDYDSIKDVPGVDIDLIIDSLEQVAMPFGYVMHQALKNAKSE